MKTVRFWRNLLPPLLRPNRPPSRGAGMPSRSLEEAPGTRSRPSTSGNRVPLLDSVENSLYTQGSWGWSVDHIRPLMAEFSASLAPKVASLASCHAVR